MSSLAKNGKIKRRRLAEFLRVEEIGSHAKRVKGTLENIVFKGMEESEKEIRAKRMWFSLFALALLIALGVTLSRHVQSEVAIFHPSACLGGWNGVEKATGEPETAKGEAFSNINSAILPENTIADLFCGDFKGEIPADTEPKVLVLRIAWSTEGSTSTNVIEGESFASSTTEILDAEASTSSEFILIEPIQINDATSSAEGGSTETSTTTATAEKNVPQSRTEIIDTASTTNEAQQSTNPVQEETGVQKSTEETVPVTEPSTPQETQVEQVPPEVPPEDTQSRGNLRGYLSFLKVFFERAHAQEVEQPSVLVVPIDTPPTEEVVQEPSVLESPIDDTPPPVSETIQATTTTEESDTTQPSVLVVPIDTPPTEEVVQEPSVLESPINDTPVSLEEIATTSSATTSDLSATSTTDLATGTEEIVSTQDTPLFDIMYSLDGTNWISLGSVALGELLATQFQIPVPEGSSWGDLSKLQLHIKRNQTVDFTPTIFLDAITLEVEVVRIPHVEPIHPDFERDVIVRDVVEEGVRIVTIINADTQEEETWYMYLEEEVSTTTESFIVATSTAEATTTTTFTMATSSNASSTETVSTSTVATGTESVRIPQMKEKNVWKKYI
ncbi:MAG: N-acetylmuramoyl-L-alanine amidase, partial [Patescibacteria group bacterium]|nr:N-acetylmuramoyl-L-alanine amidase [Patescibacteria group bacterium]